MNKLPLIATLAVAAVAAAPAIAKDKVTFNYEGKTYVYAQEKAGESTVIKGYVENGPDFYYVIRKGQVVGNTDGNPVSFSVNDAKVQRTENRIVASAD